MPFPDSSKKAPNVFLEVFDSTGSPSAKSIATLPSPSVLSPEPSPPPPPSLPDVVMNSSQDEIEYWDEYQAYLAGASTDAIFNQSIIPAGSSFINSKSVNFSVGSSQNVITEESFTSGVGLIYTIEFKINANTSIKPLMIGMFPGGLFPFNTSSNYASAYTWYDSNGYLSNYGIVEKIDTGEPYNSGDYIGVIFNSSSNNISYFKNGIFVSNSFSIGASTNYFIAGLVGSPYVPPPPTYSLRWFNPPTDNSTPVSVGNATSIEVIF